MVYYFSGTGNSEFVATTLANFLGSEKSFIPAIDVSAIGNHIDNIVFVFPVYSWGVPPLVADFIYSIPSSHWDNIKNQGYHIDCVMVCGDEVALAPEMFKKILADVGMQLNAVWSVIMPNNYVLLPGFDVDSKDIEDEKLNSCKGRILEIAESLSKGEKRIEVTRGSIPWLKTKLVYPLFKKWGIFPTKWRYNSSCISCGKCASVCPILNVEMKNDHPQWGNRCCSCLACYHICPVHAVEYSNMTLKKGQYFFPLKRISSQRCHMK